MLKNRLIPIILTKNSLVVQSYKFSQYRPIGDIKTAIEFYVNWDVDEIIIVDIDASKEKRSLDTKILNWAVRECFVPITIGGGINSLTKISSALRAGADKVCINSSFLESPKFIEKASAKFGSQCVTISIDAIKIRDGYKAYDYKTNSILDITPYQLGKRAVELGAGEILLNSINNDGVGKGYDLSLLKSLTKKIKIPVIACGGAGKFSHMSEAIKKGGCQAIAASNIFVHSELSTIAAKAQLLRDGINVRLSSSVKYDEFEFDEFGRPY